MSINGCFKFGRSREVAITSIILPNKKILVTGSNGHFATFEAPLKFKDDVRKYANRLYKNAMPSAVTTTRKSTSNDDADEVIPDSRKRAREDFEREGESVEAQNEGDANKVRAEMNEMKKKLEEEMTKMRECHKADLKEMRESLKTGLEKYKTESEEMKLRMDFNKAQCEEMKRRMEFMESVVKNLLNKQA